MLGLYIHIPFCKNVCPYCDFYKMVASEELQTKYIKALIKEMQLKNLDCISFDTLYIGGGTPSIINPIFLELLLKELDKSINLKELKEFTFECNPEDISFDLLSVLKKYYVSRISIGVQTLNPKYQNLIKRIIKYDELKEKINLLHKFEFYNYNLDLMYGFFNQTIEELKNDLDLLIGLNPTHLSIYSLMIEEHTIFDVMSKNEKLDANDEIQAKMYQFIINYLKEKNYHQYETSNFSKKGYESIHNLIYWNDEYYYCLGAGASSYVDNLRMMTTTKIHDYISDLENEKLPKHSVENLELDEIIDEYIMMNLRKTEGINKINFKERFSLDLFLYYPIINKLASDGFLEISENNVFIKQEYRYVANHLIVKIISSR